MRTPLLLAALLSVLAGEAGATPPTASYIFPAGGRRGTTVPIRVGGLFLHDRCGFHLDAPGVKATPVLEKLPRLWFEGPLLPIPESQQSEDYPVDMRGSVQIGKQAPIGPRRGFLSTSQGATSGLIFEVGDLHEVIENEVEGDPISVAVQVPVTVNGRIFPREDIDVWSLRMTRGQSVTALASTTRIRSPLLARLEVTDTSGRVLAESNANAIPGSDSSLRFIAPRDGVYYFRISDVRNLGGPAYVYRLTLTDQTVVDRVFPLGGRRGSTAAFELSGQKVPGNPVEIALPAISSEPWQNRLDLDDLPEFLAPGKSPITAPAMLNGRILKPGQNDSWQLKLESSRRYEFAVRARSLGSRLCASIELTDASGRTIAQAEGDLAQDQVLQVKPSSDGIYTLRVSERFQGRHGPELAYRLSIRDVETLKPEFHLKMQTEVANIPRGKSAKIKFKIERQNGKAPIDIYAEGLPAGVSMKKVTVPADRSDVELAFEAEELTPIATTPIQLVAKAILAGKSIEHREDFMVSVVVPTPFQFTGEYTMSTGPRGQPYRRKYKLVRNNFDGQIEISLADRQVRHLQGVTAKPIIVPSGQNEFEFAAQLPPWIEMGRTCRVTLMATGKVRDADGKEHVVSFTSVEPNHQMIVVPEPGRLGIELPMESIRLAGESVVRVPFRIARAKGLTGAAFVELASPFPNLSAKSITIAATGIEGTLEIQRKPGITPAIVCVKILATIQEPGGPVVAETRLEVVSPE